MLLALVFNENDAKRESTCTNVLQSVAYPIYASSTADLRFCTMYDGKAVNVPYAGLMSMYVVKIVIMIVIKK